MSKLEFPAGLGLYEGLSDPKIRLEIVNPLAHFQSLALEIEKKRNYIWIKIINGNCRSIELVNRIENRMFHLLVIFVAME